MHRAATASGTWLRQRKEGAVICKDCAGTIENSTELPAAARRSPPPDHAHESAPGGITVLHKTCRRLEHAVTTVLFLRLSKCRFCPSDFPNGTAPVWQWFAYRWASTGCTAQKRIQVRLHGWPANGSPRRIYPHKAYKQTALISIEA